MSDKSGHGAALASAVFMESTEAEACLRVLCAVAAADGRVDKTEADALVALGNRSVPENAVNVEREARRISSTEARRVTFEAAVALASIDGRVDPAEHRILEQLHRALELTDSFDLAVTEGEWTDRLRAHRSELADADADFLHRVAAETREGSLDSAHYTALVEELRARRQAILRDALPPVRTS